MSGRKDYSSDPLDYLIELIDKVSSSRRRELLEDAASTPPPVRKVEDFHRHTGHTLTHEMDYRELETEVDGGFRWLDGLSHLNRLLVQETDLRVEFSSDMRVKKVIKKRDPEFIQPIDLTEPLDAEDREEYQPPQEGSFTPPKDKWDLVFDATPLIREAYSKRRALHSLSPEDKERALLEMAESLIYSADYFPKHRYQGTYRADVKEALRRIENGQMTKRELTAFCFGQEDKRLAYSEQLKRRACALLSGKEKARLFFQAQKLGEEARNSLLKRDEDKRRLEAEKASLVAARGELVFSGDEEEKRLLREEIKSTEQIIMGLEEKLRNRKGAYYSSPISQSDKLMLWSIYFDRQAKEKPTRVGRVKFRKMLTAKLIKEIVVPGMDAIPDTATQNQIARRARELRAEVKRRTDAATQRIYGR